ncbi:MAG: adenylate/guanylate cyclase domain-containing protein, partial [Burkholderiales bacterium]
DTVNIASRMCTEALSGHIQVDSVTFRRLYGRFSFDEPHQIQVKGKGQMQVYNLLGRMRGDSPNTPPLAESQ